MNQRVRTGKCAYVSEFDRSQFGLGIFDHWNCKQRAVAPHGFCILHDPTPSKDPKALRRVIEDRLNETGEGLLRFDGLICPPGVSFGGLTFDRNVSFIAARFHGPIDFANTVFTGDFTAFDLVESSDGHILFDLTRFNSKYTSFRGAHFKSSVSFFAAEFRARNISFLDAVFAGETTRFNSTVFSGEEIVFTDAAFLSAFTDFVGTKFSGGTTIFFATRFRGDEVSFGAAEFGTKTRFTGTRFEAKRVDFGHARIESPVLFKGRDRFQVFLAERVEFAGIEFGEGGRLVFDGADLSRASFIDPKFYNADLSNMAFADVGWPREGSWRFGVYDEIKWRELRTKSGSTFEMDAEYLPHLARL